MGGLYSLFVLSVWSFYDQNRHVGTISLTFSCKRSVGDGGEFSLNWALGIGAGPVRNLERRPRSVALDGTCKG